MRTSARQVLALTLVATVLVAETSRADSSPPAAARQTPRSIAPRWVDRLEASLRRSVDAVALVIAPAAQQLVSEIQRFGPPEPTTAVRRVPLSPKQFPLPPPSR